MIEVLRILVFLFFAIPIFIFGLYGLVLIYFSRIRKRPTGIDKKTFGSEFKPFVSVVTPTHNEEKIITKKIENLLQSNYPMENQELIFVDDSNDSTAHLIEEYSLK
jgi:cellulose synthase/poly-beta-1,6-N-acetylglucosamine synthase-like glycosyltransferase